MTTQDHDAAQPPDPEREPLSASEKLAAAVRRKAAERGAVPGGDIGRRRAQRDANARAASQSRPALRK